MAALTRSLIKRLEGASHPVALHSCFAGVAFVSDAVAGMQSVHLPAEEWGVVYKCVTRNVDMGVFRWSDVAHQEEVFRAVSEIDALPSARIRSNAQLPPLSNLFAPYFEPGATPPPFAGGSFIRFAYLHLATHRKLPRFMIPFFLSEVTTPTHITDRNLDTVDLLRFITILHFIFNLHDDWDKLVVAPRYLSSVRESFENADVDMGELLERITSLSVRCAGRLNDFSNAIDTEMPCLLTMRGKSIVECCALLCTYEARRAKESVVDPARETLSLRITPALFLSVANAFVADETAHRNAARQGDRFFSHSHGMFKPSLLRQRHLLGDLTERISDAVLHNPSDSKEMKSVGRAFLALITTRKPGEVFSPSLYGRIFAMCRNLGIFEECGTIEELPWLQALFEDCISVYSAGGVQLKKEELSHAKLPSLYSLSRGLYGVGSLESSLFLEQYYEAVAGVLNRMTDVPKGPHHLLSSARLHPTFVPQIFLKMPTMHLTDCTMECLLECLVLHSPKKLGRTVALVSGVAARLVEYKGVVAKRGVSKVDLSAATAAAFAHLNKVLAVQGAEGAPAAFLSVLRKVLLAQWELGVHDAQLKALMVRVARKAPKGSQVAIPELGEKEKEVKEQDVTQAGGFTPLDWSV